VVCSSCAFENQPGMRFCGMCGMPLPHKPITAPGAHSTLNFTRVPVDTRTVAAARERSEAWPAGGDVAGERGRGPASFGRPQPESLKAETSVTAATLRSTDAAEPSPKELVPDVPLDEYVSKFRYEPPQDPAEKTMSWDAPVESPQPQSPPPELPNATDRAPGPVPRNTSAPAAEDVDRRLGLEPESPAEARIPRPRFLDINEPTPAPPKNETVRTLASPVAPIASAPTIGGPSFLGLSDSPQGFAEAVGVERGKYAPRNYHWRAWFAVAIVLLFAGLGYLEWRAQVQQTRNGPVEVIRTKLHDWRQTVSQMAEPAPPPGTAQPEIQVQPQPQPRQSSDASATSPEASQPVKKSDTDGGNSPAPASNAPAVPDAAPSAESPKTATGNTAATPAPDKSPVAVNNSAEQPTSEKPAAKRPPDAPSTAADRPMVPGADEMTKSKNASDPAAEAAWLWKATAKGNPDAPVQLANMYISGNGVPRSCEQALVLLKTAAEKESTVARNRLGSMYSSGTCVPRSRVEAYRWYSSSLSANPDSHSTQQTRDMIWQQMSPDERAQAQKYR